MFRGESSRTGEDDDIFHDVRSQLSPPQQSPQQLPTIETTIFLVPQCIRSIDERIYNPMIISFGPYHSHNHNLKMYHLKDKFYNQLFGRKNRDKNDFNGWLDYHKDRIRKCYSQINGFESYNFIHDLAFDAAFIVEFFLKTDEEKEREILYNTSWMISMIINDLFLLENQIPFFVLQHLYNFAMRSDTYVNLEIALAREEQGYLSFVDKLEYFINFDLREPKPSAEEVHHLLHLSHLSHRPPLPTKTVRLTNFPPQTLPSATKLLKSGVKFRLKGNTGSFMNIEFHNGVIQLPLQKISDKYYSLMRNLIAFEQCLPFSDMHVTRYAMFMKYIINTSEDVELLEREGILENAFGSTEEVTFIFSQLCKHVYVDHISVLFDEVKKFSEVNWRKWKTMFMREYFGNPWSIVSFIAAVLILFFTAVQAYTAFYGYLKTYH